MKTPLRMSGLAAIVFLASPLSVFAQQSGEMMDEQAPAQTPQDQSTMEQGAGETQQMSTQILQRARSEIAPSSVLIQTSLESALNQVQGLRAQMQASMDRPNDQAMRSIKEHREMLNTNLKNVEKEQERFKETTRKYPEVAQSENFQSLNQSIQQVESTKEMLGPKMDKKEYWSNKRQAMSDLDRLDQQLKEALQSSRQFNTGQLKLSMTA